MWTVISGMLHWRLIENSNWQAADDGKKEGATWSLSGCAILTMLNELDRAGHLKPDSKFLDLALVMGMALEWSDGQEDYGYEPEDLEWRSSVVAYARKGEIDLAEIPLHDVEKLIDGVEDAEIPARVKADQWDFKKKVSHVEKSLFGGFFGGGDNPDISPSTRNSRQDTARRRGPTVSPRWVALSTTSSR